MKREPVYTIDRPAEVPGLILVDVRYWDHESAPHAHDEWTLGLCVEGAMDEFRCGGATYRVEPGQIMAVAPGRIHSDRSVEGRMRMVYAPGLADAGMDFAPAVIEGAELARAIADLFEKKDRVAFESVREALKPWLASRKDRQLEIAAEDKPWTRIRRFRAVHGCTPEEFDRQARVMAAARSIRAGAPLGAVALDAGFFDQSHFHRHFKRVFGVSPGKFRERNSVQDTAASLGDPSTHEPMENRRTLLQAGREPV